MNDGTIICGASLQKNYWRSFADRSMDGGVTWQATKRIPVLPYPKQQPSKVRHGSRRSSRHMRERLQQRRACERLNALADRHRAHCAAGVPDPADTVEDNEEQRAHDDALVAWGRLLHLSVFSIPVPPNVFRRWALLFKLCLPGLFGQVSEHWPPWVLPCAARIPRMAARRGRQRRGRSSATRTQVIAIAGHGDL